MSDDWVKDSAWSLRGVGIKARPHIVHRINAFRWSPSEEDQKRIQLILATDWTVDEVLLILDGMKAPKEEAPKQRGRKKGRDPNKSKNWDLIEGELCAQLGRKPSAGEVDVAFTARFGGNQKSNSRWARRRREDQAGEGSGD